MFTDMVGYSALVQADEAAALQLLKRHNRLLRPLFARFGGTEIKTVGDAFLVEFESALDASRCALEIQKVLREHNRTAPVERQIRIRIGLHVGDVVRTNGDVLGDAVNIASRIEPLAEPGGICLTQQVVDQVQNKVPVGVAKLPPVPLKNIRTPVVVYRFNDPGAPAIFPRDGPDAPPGRALAVLPLANISPDHDDEYFADGLTEELISTLSQVRDLSVIARTSVATYKHAPKPIPVVGAELGVSAVLEGSVRKAGNRIRITLQLVDVPTQRHIWSSSYNREIDDVFAVQTEIAESTAKALRLEFAKSEGSVPRSRPVPHPQWGIATGGDAYDAYLRGLVAASNPRGPGFDEAVRCFEQATNLDPTLAEAFAAWANLYVIVGGMYRSMKEVMPKARELASKALALDPDSSDAHEALGNIALQLDHDWPRTEAEFEKAIALNPNNVEAYRFYGLYHFAMGRFDEAKELIRRTIRLDPGGEHHGMLIWAEAESGHFDTAIRMATDERDRDPESLMDQLSLGNCLLSAGRRADALRVAESPRPPSNEDERYELALFRARLGQPESAREIAAEFERGEAKSYTSDADMALLYGALGDRERALDRLERDSREGDQVLWLYYRSPHFDGIRGDPRFVALLRKFGLPTAPVHGVVPAGE
jgi:adenylate cyclase